MSYIRHFITVMTALSLTGLPLASCSSDGEDDPKPSTSTDTDTPSVAPDFNSEIEPFDTSTRTTDSYTPGSDNDIYWQANDFTGEVTVVFAGDSATVSTTASTGITTVRSGAHVAIDITSDIKTRINVTGNTSDGSIKIYSPAKTLLVLDNAEITSTKGPAINCQSKKRLFIEIPEGGSSKLTDEAVYSDDHYYQSGSSASAEDRKGAVFAEGNVIVSGKGLLQIDGHYRHALATDGYLRILPGTTLAVTTDVKNGLHAKGSSKEANGIVVDGGYIYVLCTGDAGKCMKSDMDITIKGGTLSLNNSSEAIFDTDDNSASSGAGIKSDENINITGGEITVKLTGNGAKGISADSDVNIAGADITVTSTGSQFVHSIDSSSPAGIKAKNDISISSGTVNTAMYGEDNSSDAIKASGRISITGGQTYCYAYGNGLYATGSLGIAGGYVYSLSERSEAITSKDAINITGGYVLSHSPKAITSSSASILTVSDATVIAAGGRSMTTTGSGSASCKLFGSVNLAAYQPFAVASSSGTPLLVMQFLPACEDMPLMIASPSFRSGTTWTLAVGGTISSGSDSWNGLRIGASLTDPTSTTTFSL